MNETTRIGRSPAESGRLRSLTEHPRRRGPFARLARFARFARLGVAMLASLVLTGCGSLPASPTPGTSTGPTPRASPTPVPTPLVTHGPTPTEGAVEDVDLVVRVTTCVELCVPTPGTTVLSDRWIIWTGPADRPLTARLTPEGMRRVTDEIGAHRELETSGEYQAELLPGAEPFPRGTSIYRFELHRPEPRAIVAGDPADYALEPELWVIPPAMERLAGLARQLLDPIAWLGTDALEGPIRPYESARYVVIVDLVPGVGAMPEFPADIDDVDSPFADPFENLGEPVQVDEGGFPVRCLVIDADTARRLAAAEIEAGVQRDVGAWSSGIAYRWARGQGFVQVTLRQVLPHQDTPCQELEVV